MALNAERLLRLYPRRWRERYGDELRALLGETAVTPAVLLDLLIGASREWMRTLTGPPEPPVSMDGEIWRSWRRAAVGALAIGGIATFVARELTRRQVLSEDYGWVLMLGMVYAATRTVIAQLKYIRLLHRRTLGFMPPPSPGQFVATGIGRTEFWICMLLMVVGTSAHWTLAMHHSWEIVIRWMSLFLYTNFLRSSTRADFARREWLIQRGIAERNAKRMA